MGTMIEIHPDELERCQGVWDLGAKAERLRLEMTEGRRRMFVWEEDGIFCGGGSLVLKTATVKQPYHKNGPIFPFLR